MANKQKKISFRILRIAGVTTLFLAASILAPQLPFLLLRAALKQKFKTDYNHKQIRNSVAYLRRKKFIAYQKQDGKWKLILTKLGKQKLTDQEIAQIKITAQTWDGQWRLLTFDIPEESKPAREAFRRKLKELGFFHFQRSVFILPYECEKEIEQVTDYLNVSNNVHLITANRFKNDKGLIKKFRL
ncbi:MAG: CRISPR-associated endonuclease Cas2 [bacterium]|nr:CRISPR-associated endonuclease Cas2 [bacterium]